jgi:hypothetical protein
MLTRVARAYLENFYHPLIGGCALGLSLTLSLRRYIPFYHRRPVAFKFAIEFTTFMTVSTYVMWTQATPRYVISINDIRQELVKRSTVI